jgi:hypothetical protein
MTARMKRGMLPASGSRRAELTFGAQQVARALVYMASPSLEANVQFVAVTATKVPFVVRGWRARTPRG